VSNDDRLRFGCLLAADPVQDLGPFRAAGMSSIGLAAWEGPPAETEDVIRHFRSSARRHRLEIESVHAGWDLLDAWRPREIPALLQRDLEFTAGLGARILTIHYSIFVAPDRLIVDPDGKPRATITVDRDLSEWPPMLDRIHSRLATFCKMAAEHGVTLALETDGSNSDRLLEFIGNIGPERCGVCFDTGHAQINYDAVALAEELGSRVVCTHLHDNKCQSRPCPPPSRGIAQARRAFNRYDREDIHLLPLKGVIDWPGLLRALRHAGYRGRLTYETGPVSALPPINARLRRLWAQAAV
jgi:sugar phosphate isomerase/epimerase